ncbi:MAG: hypoxanthine phosphoribosyltransferase [Bacteroidota bacterium]
MNSVKPKIIQLKDLYFREYLSVEQIQERVAAMGAEIRQNYAHRNPIFISILNGAFMFAADLVRACNIDCELSFVKLSSYKGTQSSGTVTTVIGLDTVLEGRDIVIIEDIIDTGRTLHGFMQQLKEEKPKSIALASLLVKPDALQYHLQIDYTGFSIPNHFVVGYGLDYDSAGRHLPSIYQLTDPT